MRRTWARLGEGEPAGEERLFFGDGGHVTAVWPGNVVRGIKEIAGQQTDEGNSAQHGVLHPCHYIGFLDGEDRAPVLVKNGIMRPQHIVPVPSGYMPEQQVLMVSEHERGIEILGRVGFDGKAQVGLRSICIDKGFVQKWVNVEQRGL